MTSSSPVRRTKSDRGQGYGSNGLPCLHNVAGGFEGPLDDEASSARWKASGSPGCRAKGGRPLLKDSAPQSLKPLQHMSKIRISEEFTTISTDFIRVATLEELKTAGMIVVRGARCPVSSFMMMGKCLPSITAALIFRFPLHRGSVEDGVSAFHMARCRWTPLVVAPSTCGLTMLPRRQSSYAMVSCGSVRRPAIPTVTPTGATDCARGFGENIGLVLAKAVLGLIRQGVPYRALVRGAILFGARNRNSWGMGLTHSHCTRQAHSLITRGRDLSRAV